MLYYTIPVTDGDTAPSSSQESSTTPQGAVKTSSPVVGKCILAQHLIYTSGTHVTILVHTCSYIPQHMLCTKTANEVCLQTLTCKYYMYSGARNHVLSMSSIVAISSY